uniref:Uncharacterized protein n=1 Tax=viral metagenome TaxID=1070528 RepID=A0A6M3XII8_9ZZZZ
MKTKAALGLQGSNLDLDEAIALGVQYFLLLAPEGIIGGDIQRLIDLCWVAGTYALFIIRFYSPDRMGMTAPKAAQADYEWMLAHTTPEQREHIIAVIPANELNLACEHQDGKVYGDYWSTYNGYRTIDGWLVSWAEVWKQMAATHGWKPEIWWPALAPGHQPAQGTATWYSSIIEGPPPESEYELLRTSMTAYDAIGIHVYGPIADEWTGSGRLARIVDKLQLLGFGNKPMHVTEVNQVNFAQFLAFASVVGIEISIWFLWVSAAEDHRPWNLRGSPYIAGLKEYIAEEGETPMPTPTGDLAHIIWDDAYQWRDKPKPKGFNPNTAIGSYIEMAPGDTGAALTCEFDDPTGRFRCVKCALSLVIADKRNWYTNCAANEEELREILQRWGYYPKV